jgi:hypothetical protein
MGYYVNTTDCRILVKRENADKALLALVKFNDENDEKKNGGSFGPDGAKEKWFSWMPKDFREFDTFGKFLSSLGFSYFENEEMDYVLTGYSDKAGQEDLLLEAIASFIEDGSFAEWSGEDGERWRWDFKGGKMTIRNGVVTWSDETYTPSESFRMLQAELEAVKKAIGEFE